MEQNEQNLNKLKIYFNNINSFTSKGESMRHLTQVLNPDIIALCETKLPLKVQPNLEGYNVKKCNLKGGKEGLAVAIKSGTCNSVEVMHESEEKNIMTVEVRYPNDEIRLVVAHGPQEKENLEIRKEFFHELEIEVERGKSSGKGIMIMGDLNARIEPAEGEIEGKSPNGKLLKELVDKYELRARTSLLLYLVIVVFILTLE